MTFLRAVNLDEAGDVIIINYCSGLMANFSGVKDM